ncbi:hypothetical protein TWF106_001251 [Orbilia oligospora]|uniref:PNPLA domain-containing protein n=1 Tax=Orbilia oligospora TaxID=2813651 RepID=A0A7C8URD2_ORBOL|nr:hypothetical protein TWF788_007339 [Orbilia oligospora]KAF3211089.1 hypothetical protein TWF679_006580 [Orbilia oligospora]KAF3226035.1 hypothetical protein TWF106_001251 [Orbilia oligospora]
MAGRLPNPTGFVPPYPVTPPATPTPAQSNYFQTGAPSSSSSSSQAPPPRPPKLPNLPDGHHHHPNTSNLPPLPPREPTSTQNDHGRQERHNVPSRVNQNPASSSLPRIPQLPSLSEDTHRRKSDDQRWAGPPSQIPPSSSSTFLPPRADDSPPVPPPKSPPQNPVYNLQSSSNLQMSQISLSQSQATSDTRAQRPRGASKSTKGKAHLGEMERLRRSKNAARSRLRILSLDGGGIRGYSTLLLLEALMHDIFVEIHGRAPRRGEEVTKPCEVFDLIGGTGTGGLIAIMLGRLRMSVQTCKDVYTRMTRYVFETDKRFVGIPYGETLYKASKLERAIRTVVYERTKHDHLDLNMEMNSEDEDWDLEPSGGHYEDEEKELERRMSLMGRTDSIKAIAEASRIASLEGGRKLRQGNADALMHDKRKGRCKTMITAVYKGSSSDSTPAIFRTYSSGVESMSYPDCRIWQAGRATCATLAAFKSIRINQDVFLDEGTGRYNPTPTVLEEACVNEWPGREVGLIVSLGTGKRPEGAREGDNKVQWWENLGTSLDQFTQARRRLMTKIDYCETTHQYVLNEELTRYGISKNRYFRFNVDAGVGEVALNEWSRLSEVSTATKVYLAGPEVGTDMKECARRMAKLTRDKWKKKIAADGGIMAEEKKAMGMGSDSLKMEAKANGPVPTVYYEMPGDVPTQPTPASIMSPPPRSGDIDQQLEQLFAPVEMPAAPRVPAIRITPPSVKKPNGRTVRVEMPGNIPE